jgi:hypothetical protein|tara:strand:+ start:312 stop:506 length:195 start_codon:yes stop_codon:yes gene_type:complete
MIQQDNNHTHQADSFDSMYAVANGMKKEFDDAFAKWAKKKGIKTGFPKKKMNQQFVSEANRKKK